MREIDDSAWPAGDWVRLVPFSGPEFADISEPAPVARDERGRPLPMDRVVDRKLAPAADLISSYAVPPRIMVSERFVRALADEGVSGWRATSVPHVTPNLVSGYQLYYLEIDGWMGPFVDTELTFAVPHEKFSDEQPNGLPTEGRRDCTRLLTFGERSEIV
jgi:hypothetical protein